MSDPVQHSNRNLSDKAKELEKLGQFAQAAVLYKQSYDQYPGSFVTSHYIMCLRKLGKSTEAVEFGRTLSKQLLDDPYVHKHLSWALYDVYLKKSESIGEDGIESLEPEKQKGQDFQQMQKIAGYILRKAPVSEELLRKRTILAICKQAKLLGNWQVVYNFTIQLDPEQLSREQVERDGQKLPSEYQNWLYKMVGSLFELKRYEECVSFAQKGIEQYPREKLFFWWRASAKKALGQVEEALHELEQIDIRFPKEWYIQRDIAGGYLQLQRYDEAMIWFCKAADSHGEIKHRYKMIQEMSVLYEHLEQLQEAHDHLQLACAIAEREGWEQKAANLRGQLVQFRRRHADLSNSPSGVTIEDWSKLYPRCQALWKKATKASLPTCKGRIIKLNNEKGFGFIKRYGDESSKDVYFRFRNLVRGLTPDLGMEVEFELQKSFDPGKNEEGLAALNVRPTKDSV